MMFKRDSGKQTPEQMNNFVTKIESKEVLFNILGDWKTVASCLWIHGEEKEQEITDLKESYNWVTKCCDEEKKKSEKRYRENLELRKKIAILEAENERLDDLTDFFDQNEMELSLLGNDLPTILEAIKGVNIARLKELCETEAKLKKLEGNE